MTGVLIYYPISIVEGKKMTDEEVKAALQESVDRELRQILEEAQCNHLYTQCKLKAIRDVIKINGIGATNEVTELEKLIKDCGQNGGLYENEEVLYEELPKLPTLIRQMKEVLKKLNSVELGYCLDNNVTIKSFIHASLVMSLKEIDNAKKSAKR